MPTIRTDLTATVVKEALAAAAARRAGVNLWADNRDRHLLIRQRGPSADWLVKSRGRTRVIGALRERDPEYLSVSAARSRALDVVAEIRRDAAGEGATVGRGTAWTWADLDRAYQASLTEHRLSGGRVKPPSKSTQDDVRLAFAKPPVAGLGPTTLTALTALDVIRAIDRVHLENGHRQAAKTLSFIKAALSWALSKRGEVSGLHGTMPWWQALQPPDPTGQQILAMQARQRQRAANKAAFGVDHLGELLVRHDAFCAEARGQSRVGPGVRFGLWFLAFTGGRRSSTAALERAGLLQTDPMGRSGWGRAMWSDEAMKGKSEFWLPLDPAMLSIANAAVADRDQLVHNTHGPQCQLTSRWVFASTRGAVEDIATHPSSLNAHLRNMRGAKKRKTPGEPKDWLAGLPYFTLHLVRAVAGSFLDTAPGVSSRAVSAFLAHAGEKGDDQLAAITRDFYVVNQRMDLKADAVAAWSEALQRAVEKAGGKMPAATAGPPVSKLRTTAA